MKLFVLAVDAMDPSYLTEYGEQLQSIGALKHQTTLDSMSGVDDTDGIDEAAPGDRYPNSWSLWTDFATGVDYHKHRVKYARYNPDNPEGFPDWEETPDGVRFWMRTDIPDEVLMLYNALNLSGYSVGWSRFPVTSFPPSPLDGWMISGSAGYPPGIWPTNYRHILDIARHPSLNEETLWQLATVRSIEEANEAGVVDGNAEAFVKGAAGIEERYWQAFVQMNREMPVDCAFHYIRHSDGVGHILSKYPGLVGMFYARVDEMFSEFVEEFQPEHVMIISDHGMKPLEGDSPDISSDDDEKCQGFVNIRGRKELAYISAMHGGLTIMTGGHDRYGVILTDFPTDEKPQDMRAVYPTLMHLLCGTYDVGSLDKPSFLGDIPTSSPRVRDRLRGLGYVDG